jgi:hypothetical protein
MGIRSVDMRGMFAKSSLNALTARKRPYDDSRREGSSVMQRLAIALPLFFGIATFFCITSSAQAIECLSAPNQSGSGWWSWREIDGRKCWYRKVGAVPPKSEFSWPKDAKTDAKSDAKEAMPEGTREPSAMPATVMPTALRRVALAHVKPVVLTDPNYRLSDVRVGLMEGFDLSGARGVGGTWAIPLYIESPGDAFDARYGQW